MTDRYRDALPVIANAFETADQYATALEAAVDRVRALHHHISITTRGATAPEDRCRGCQQAWPCPTVQALDGT